MKLSHIAAAFTIFACATATHSQSAGSFLVSTGWLHFAPQDSSQPLQITNVNGVPSNVSIADSGASVNDADTLGFTGMYFITDHIASELAVGTPPRFDLNGVGVFGRFGQLASVKQWSPVLLFKYYFFDAETKFRPYAGLGISRVWFTDVHITNPTFEREELHGPTSVSVDSRWAAVFNGGFSYQFNAHWFGGLSVSYLPLRTTATLQTDAHTPLGPVPVTSKADIKLNPIITYLNIGYRF